MLNIFQLVLYTQRNVFPTEVETYPIITISHGKCHWQQMDSCNILQWSVLVPQDCFVKEKKKKPKPLMYFDSLKTCLVAFDA